MNGVVMESEIVRFNRRGSSALRLCANPKAPVEDLAFELFIIDTHLHYVRTRAESPFVETEFGPAIGFDGYQQYLLTLTYLETAKSQLAYQISIRQGSTEQ